MVGCLPPIIVWFPYNGCILFPTTWEHVIRQLLKKSTTRLRSSLRLPLKVNELTGHVSVHNKLSMWGRIHPQLTNPPKARLIPPGVYSLTDFISKLIISTESNLLCQASKEGEVRSLWRKPHREIPKWTEPMRSNSTINARHTLVSSDNSADRGERDCFYSAERFATLKCTVNISGCASVLGQHCQRWER